MTVTIDSMAHGGDGVARRDGKAVFVTGAIPGDCVTIKITEDKGRFERAVMVDLVDASPSRVTPVCPHFASCGGCQWQMAEYRAQLEWKRDVVRSQLAHIGRMEADVAPVRSPSAPVSYRNRMDFRIVDGRPAMLRLASHDTVAISECHLLVPPLAILFQQLGPLQGGRLTLRAGVNTGETLVLVDDAEGVVHEQVGGRRFRISNRAFFQVNTLGAEALVELVGAVARVGSDDVVLDAYAGGGLFAATVGADAGTVVAVESDRTALGDLAVNVANARVIDSTVELALPGIESADVVIVDPPRNGLGRRVVDEIARISPRTVAYVSCDPASFARDARLLVDAGYTLGTVTPVDMFPQTYHVELVAAFER
ncbi:MAG: class I SAM-dependent RNA methyltransferase [Acidimicrobiia bacterium]